MELDKRIEQKLQKLLALAERGEGGEKSNAERMLKRLLDKHGLNISDLSDEQTDTYWLKYKGPFELRLLSQIIGAVRPGATKWKNRKKRQTLGVDTTKQQMLEIGLMFNAYKKALHEEIEILYIAFIHKNDIFPEDQEPERSEEKTPEERARLFKVANMMNGMAKTAVLNGIAKD